MAKTIQERAIELSKLEYIIELLRDKTTDGDYIYLARNPELEGCMAQGLTEEEAIANLGEVRVEHIEHLLEHSLEVPRPNHAKATSTLSVVTQQVAGVTLPGFEDYLTKVVQANDREILYSITPKT